MPAKEHWSRHVQKKNPTFPEASTSPSEIDLLVELIEMSNEDFKATVRESFDQLVSDGEYEEDDWEDFFESEKNRANMTGHPKFCLYSPKPYSPSEWIFHFTEASAYDVAEGFDRGVELEYAGLSQESPDWGPLIYGYPRGRTRLGGYGRNLVMFKANCAIVAYHSSDEEHQVIADRDTVTQTIGFSGSRSPRGGGRYCGDLRASATDFLGSGLVHPGATEEMAQAAIYLHGEEFDGMAAFFNGSTMSEIGSFVDEVLDTLNDPKNHPALEILGGEWFVGDVDEVAWRSAKERDVVVGVLVREGGTAAIPKIPPQDLYTGRSGLRAARDQGYTATYRKSEDMIVIFREGFVLEQ